MPKHRARPTITSRTGDAVETVRSWGVAAVAVIDRALNPAPPTTVGSTNIPAAVEQFDVDA